MKEISQGEMLLYQDENGSTQIEVRLENENVWLTQAQLVTLYQSSKANVSEHIKHIFEEGELEEKVTVRKFRTVQKNILTVVRKFRTTAVGRVSHQEAIEKANELTHYSNPPNLPNLSNKLKKLPLCLNT